MKKLLALLLAVLLLLTACGGQTEETVPTVETTEPEPTGLYIPGSDVEEQTGGAVRSYDLGGTGYYRIEPMSDRLLIFSGEENTVLTVLSDMEGFVSGQLQLPLDLRETSWQLTDSGFAYYDPQSRQVVYLDTQLLELHRVDLPEDMSGMPVIAADGAEIYYCLGQEVRGLDTQRGISRLIKSQSCKSQSLVGSSFDGKLLTCNVVSEEDENKIIYISAENGSTKSQDAGIRLLQSYEDRYFVFRMDGITPQYISGISEGESYQWNTGDGQMYGALPIGIALGAMTDEEGAVHLSAYDVTTGQKTAAVTLGQSVLPTSVCADRWSNSVWMLMEGETAQFLLRWNVKDSAIEEDGVYLGTVVTAETPDEAGLDVVRDRVDDINNQHGISIRIWNDAVKYPGEHTLEPEYQVYAIQDTIDKLEPILQLFPENFLRKSVSSKIRICIVRSIDGERSVARYWEDGDAYIILSAGIDPEEEMILAISYIVDSHILGNSPMLDAWDGLNPEGFSYGGELPAGALEGETRAFVDADAAATVADDRARTFWQAMQPDNAEMFSSPVMQAKLLLLCQSIRDAWRLERKTETYLWEQYLTESIAYKS